MKIFKKQYLCLFFCVCSFTTKIWSWGYRIQVAFKWLTLLQLVLDNTLPAMSKTSLDFVFFKIEKAVAFFAFSPLHLSKPLGKQKVVVCDWWFSIRFVCFCVSGFVALFLKSTVSFTLALSFFVLFILNHGKFRFPRWNCSYWASKSRRNTDTEGWKRTGMFPLAFTLFANKHSGCYGNGLIDVVEKFEFEACPIWIVEDVSRGSFLFPTYLGRLKETLFAG